MSENCKFRDDMAFVGGSWRKMRDLLHEMDENSFSALSSEYEIWHFLKSHRHCGYCGAETVLAGDDEIHYAKKCPNPDCEGSRKVLFPSYSIASITIVARKGGKEILLGHNTAWPEGRFSLFAGFMQPGENLEECARREIKEECGLEVGSIRYIKSQTWPFPSNIMAGFYAVAEDGEARPDGREIDKVFWINRSEMEKIIAGTSDTGITLPKKGSLARKLIGMWLSDSFQISN